MSNTKTRVATPTDVLRLHDQADIAEALEAVRMNGCIERREDLSTGYVTVTIWHSATRTSTAETFPCLESERECSAAIAIAAVAAVADWRARGYSFSGGNSFYRSAH